MRVLDHGPYEAPGSVLMVASFKGSRRVLWRFRLWVIGLFGSQEVFSTPTGGLFSVLLCLGRR